MRVLASADLHGDHNIYRWLVEVSVDVQPDALVLAGDLLGSPDGYDAVEEAQQADAGEILALLYAVKQPIFYIMGNDDMVELEPGESSIRSIHGQKVALGDINFVGYQYSLPFMAGIYEKTEEEIQKDLTSIETLVDRRTVLVTHCPAYGILDAGVMDMHAGSNAVKDLIDRKDPLLHIHGHVHKEFGRSGRHFNVASAGHYRTMLIDTTTLDHQVMTKGPI